MGRNVVGMVKIGPGGMLVAAFFVALLALVFLLTVPAKAQNTSRAATDLAGKPAKITESTTDTDEIVDRIVVAVGGCRVDADASVAVKDDDGTRARLTNGGNVRITADADAVRIVGTGDGGNIEGINASGGDGQFGTVDETVDGEVVSSTGIRCEDNNANNNNNDDNNANNNNANNNNNDDNNANNNNVSQDQYGGDLNCDDFDSQVAAQANLDDNPDDSNNLDADDDGDACEDFPFGNVIDDDNDEDLPDTGGVPLTLLGAICLAVASLALVRTVRRG